MLNEFIRKDDEEYANITNTGDSCPIEIPVIDISLLTSSHLELHRLKTAITTWAAFRQLTMEWMVPFWIKFVKSADCSSIYQLRRRRNT
ncbi:hypothetical protein HanIR_Chr15g0761481 [Helianthus annuus]|nr:hypothetical protein HanIR_Chr15g0761481 [Helianthus annuus]